MKEIRKTLTLRLINSGLLGKIPDAILAKKFDCSRQLVYTIRQNLKIPAPPRKSKKKEWLDLN